MGSVTMTSDRETSVEIDFHRIDGFTCVYCGRTPMNDGAQLHVDYVKPKVAGGSDEKTNLVTACRACNLGKGARLLNTVTHP